MNNSELRAAFGRRASGNSAPRRAVEATSPAARGFKDYAYYGALALCGIMILGFVGFILESPETRQARMKEDAARRVEYARQEAARAQRDAEQAKLDAKAARAEACAGKEIQAYVMTQDAVRARLKAPSTAEFPWATEIVSAHAGDCRYEVLAYVDARNGFGATLRTAYGANLTYLADSGSWRIDSVRLKE